MKKYKLLFSFLILVSTLTVLSIFSEDIKFSELENRKLKQKPSFSLESFVKGNFGEDYEEYINDQFVFRNMWINLKSRSEYLLGKIENNGIIYGKNDYLFDKFITVDEERLNRNINALELFLKAHDNSTLMIVPSSYAIYNEWLPYGAPVINQEEEINKIYEKVNNKINLVDLMNQNKNQYIYYRTDHHWTTLGAFLAYSKYVESKNLNSKFIFENESEVNDFYGTYYSKAKPFNAVPDILTFNEVDNINMKIEDGEYDSLYDYNYLESVDKYSLFLRGNNALSVIKNGNLNNGKKILVIKDSYGNSFVPFLTSNFEEIHVIDLRAFMISINDYIHENNFDEILVLYSFVNFAKDTNIVKLKF